MQDSSRRHPQKCLWNSGAAPARGLSLYSSPIKEQKLVVESDTTACRQYREQNRAAILEFEDEMRFWR